MFHYIQLSCWWIYYFLLEELFCLYWWKTRSSEMVCSSNEFWRDWNDWKSESIKWSDYGEDVKTSQPNPSNFCHVCKGNYGLALMKVMPLWLASTGYFWWIVAFNLSSWFQYISKLIVLTVVDDNTHPIPPNESLTFFR